MQNWVRKSHSARFLNPIRLHLIIPRVSPVKTQLIYCQLKWRHVSTRGVIIRSIIEPCLRYINRKCTFLGSQNVYNSERTWVQFIIINIKEWTLWSVPSPESQLLSPTFLRSPNCSPSLVVCGDLISKGFGLVAFFASVIASFVCIHLSCLVCIQSVVHGVRSRLFCGGIVEIDIYTIIYNKMYTCLFYCI
jgi:hypothetical protein